MAKTITVEYLGRRLNLSYHVDNMSGVTDIYPVTDWSKECKCKVCGNKLSSYYPVHGTILTCNNCLSQFSFHGAGHPKFCGETKIKIKSLIENELQKRVMIK